MNETKPALRSKCTKILRVISTVKSIELYRTGRIPVCQQQGPESEYGHFPDPSPWTPTATIYCPRALFQYHTALIFLQHLFQPSRSSSYLCLHFNFFPALALCTVVNFWDGLNVKKKYHYLFSLIPKLFITPANKVGGGFGFSCLLFLLLFVCCQHNKTI